ncbi:conserved hypothetical protein [Methanocella paludicola SANAE]|uniref:Uncharacterized protein n=2 Tax=Methanocella TaxID=570266 RepID=D1YY79_METPS|nr:conserved hypothetical protein [Methanocella paludicola SANAE]
MGANNISESSDIAEAAVPKMRLPTGVDILDRNLSGGLPIGALVYFSANPKSMPEVFLLELATPRKTYYITTSKDPRYIMRDMKELDLDVPDVEFLDLHSEYYQKILPHEPDKHKAIKKLIEFLNNWLATLESKKENDFTIIFDSFSFLVELGVDADELKTLLDRIYDIINDGNGICYLMMIKGVHHESVESRIQYWCDVIFDIDLERKGDKIVNKLTLPKIRGMSPVTDYIKFKVTDRITIDTSRDIV